jgi:two-component sensor histidine kinase/PAS domain-containing protein
MKRGSNDDFPPKVTVWGAAMVGGVTAACGLVILTGWLVGWWPWHAQVWQVVVLASALGCGAAASVGLVWQQQRARLDSGATAAEAALQVERRNLDAIFESSPVAMLILDEATRIVRFNSAALVLTGGVASDVLQRRPGNAMGCVHSLKDPRGCGYSVQCPFCPLRNSVEALIARGGSLHGAELVLELLRNGKPQKVRMRIGAETVLLNGRRHVCLSMEDITERTEAMETLAESERRLATLMANLPGMAYRCQNLPDWPMVFVSEGCSALTGWSPADLMQNRPAYGELIVPSDRESVWDAVQVANEARQPFELTDQSQGADGRIKGVWERGRGVFGMAGGLLFLEGFIADITERRLAEEWVKASLLEKESLLKEIHHRVKNNLQIISSLLRLQAGKMNNAVAKAALLDMQNRVHSMALIHESLYGSETFASVDIAAYLTQLCQQLCRVLSAAPGRIQLHLDLAPVHLSIDQAIPCGLLVNELVSNAFKHAFPDDRSGELRVELRASTDGQGCCLRVADNGVGLAPDFDLQHLPSLGLKLVTDLVRQIGGHLEIGGGPGAVFEIEFKAS